MSDRWDKQLVVCVTIAAVIVILVMIALGHRKVQAAETPDPKPKFTCQKVGTTGLGGYVIWEVEVRGKRYLVISGNGPAICPEVE